MNDVYDLYKECTLCPRGCKVNRYEKSGFCNMGADAVVNIAMLHHGEEPPISGDPDNGNGSGTVFFEGCSLRCPFCQNYCISNGPTGKGMKVNASELAKMFLQHQENGAYNINLVTPMHFAPTVADAIRISKSSGLHIPVAINTGAYDKRETLSLFEGLVDIYMPDFKFWSDKLSKEVINASDYSEIAIEAIDEMYRQTGPIVLNSQTGLMEKGIIVRHLMMPGKLFDSKKVIDYLTSKYGNNIYISLMNQYTPMPQLQNLSKQRAVPDYLFKTVPYGHYESMCDYLAQKDQENAFVQDSSSQGDSMIPPFLV